MSFDAILETILDACPDAQGVTLMGNDGIPISHVERPGFDVNLVGVEFGRLVAELQKASDAAGGSAVDEFCVHTSNYWVLLRPLDEDIFLMAALQSDANFGKARFEMRCRMLELKALL